MKCSLNLMRLFSVLTAFFCYHPHHLWANDLFEYQGPYTRASGGAGDLMERSGAACFHNPSNLIMTRSHGYADIGLSHWNYVLDPRDEDLEAGKITLPVVPLVSMGGSYKPKKDWAFGVVVVPLGLPGVKQKVKKFPFRGDGVKVMVDAETQRASYKVGLGTAYGFGQVFRLGLSVIYHKVDETMTLLSDVSDDPILDITTTSSYLTYRVGISGRIGSGLNWSLSYQPSAVERYVLGNRLLSGQSASANGRLYKAQKVTTGVGYRFAPQYTGYVQYSREFWVNGTFKSTAPLDYANNGDVPTEYLDTNNYTLGLKIRLAKTTYLYGSFSEYGSNKGAGVFDEDDQLTFGGIGAQDFEALKRRHYTIGNQMNVFGRNIVSYLTYITGEKSAANGTPGQGDHDLKILMLGSGFIFR